MKVLGVDAGLRICGYCLCEINKSGIKLINDGEIKNTSKTSLPEKLNLIFECLHKIIKRYKPEVMVVEKLYSHYRHPTTVGLLAQVKGVLALLAYKDNLDFFEFSPTKVRKSFLGRGNVNSLQVKKLAESITGKQFKSLHTADAFSLVIAFSHSQRKYDFPFKR